MAPGTILALFGFIYYWFPKATGRKMNDRLGKLHFWGTITFMNVIFMPMFIQGLAGVSRRLYDGGAQYAHAAPVLEWNVVMSIGAWALAIAQIPFFINFFRSMFKGEKVKDGNTWEATTLEWSAASSPPIAHGNFETVPSVYRGPYEYSAPGFPQGYAPQNAPDKA